MNYKINRQKAEDLIFKAIIQHLDRIKFKNDK